MRSSRLLLLALVCVAGSSVVAQPPRNPETMVLENAGPPPARMLFNAFGDQLLLVDRDGHLATRSIWDPQAPPSTLLADRAAKVLAVAPTGAFLAVWSPDRGVEVVDLWGDVSPRRLARGDFASLRSLSFAPDGATLVGRTDANQVIRWSVETGDVAATHTLPDFTGPTALAADGEFAVGFRAADGLVVWDVARGEVRHALEASDEPPVGIAISPDGRYIAAAPADNADRVNVWDAASGHLLQKLAVPGAEKTLLQFTTDGQSLTVADAEGLVTVWQLATGVPFCRFALPPDARDAFAVSRDAELLAAARPDGTIVVWPLESEFGRPPQVFAAVAEPAEAAAPEAAAEEAASEPTFGAAAPGDFELGAPAPTAPAPTAPAPAAPAPSVRLSPPRDAAPPVAASPEAPNEPAAGAPAADADGYKYVPVFFGTNRRNDRDYSWSDYFLGFFFTWLAAAIYACMVVGVLLALAGRTSRLGRWIVGLGIAALVILGAIYAQSKSSRVFDTAGDEYVAAAGPLRFGRCYVSVPPSHESGVLETPLEIWVYRGTERPDKHIMIQSLTPLSADEFARQLNRELERSPGKDAFVFIHGYNVPFRDAIRRTAQLAVDLEFPGPAICYSWPSHADPLRYLFDETNAAASVGPLRDFLRHVTTTTSAERIHVVAHSMGNRVLTAALQHLNDAERARFGYIVLAAPDIDRREFLDPIAPAIAAAGLHVTLYASSNDNALWLSKRFHDFQRAGDTLPDLTLCDGVETIDASIVDTSLLGHSYYGDRPTMIKDLAALLLENKTAAQRLRDNANQLNGHTYWMIVP